MDRKRQAAFGRPGSGITLCPRTAACVAVIYLLVAFLVFIEATDPATFGSAPYQHYYAEWSILGLNTETKSYSITVDTESTLVGLEYGYCNVLGTDWSTAVNWHWDNFKNEFGNAVEPGGHPAGRTEMAKLSLNILTMQSFRK